jgi:hypothetical protein
MMRVVPMAVMVALLATGCASSGASPTATVAICLTRAMDVHTLSMYIDSSQGQHNGISSSANRRSGHDAG